MGSKGFPKPDDVERKAYRKVVRLFFGNKETMRYIFLASSALLTFGSSKMDKGLCSTRTGTSSAGSQSRPFGHGLSGGRALSISVRLRVYRKLAPPAADMDLVKASTSFASVALIVTFLYKTALPNSLSSLLARHTFLRSDGSLI